MHSYPSGCTRGVRRVCAGQRHPPEVWGPPCRAVSHRNVVARTSLPVTPRRAALDQQKSSATGPAKHFARRCDGWTFQRLGLNAGGGAERGSGRRLSCEVVVVRRVAGTAAEVAGSWFGVSGS
jgi:hypothetical protein